MTQLEALAATWRVKNRGVCTCWLAFTRFEHFCWVIVCCWVSLSLTHTLNTHTHTHTHSTHTHTYTHTLSLSLSCGLDPSSSQQCHECNRNRDRNLLWSILSLEIFLSYFHVPHLSFAFIFFLSSPLSLFRFSLSLSFSFALNLPFSFPFSFWKYSSS